jgi:anti-anti-sigma factor
VVIEQLQLSAVRVRWQDGILVLVVAGELDVLTAEVLDRELTALAAAGHSRIVLNVESLAFCDACGLRVLNMTSAMHGGSFGPVIAEANVLPEPV